MALTGLEIFRRFLRLLCMDDVYLAKLQAVGIYAEFYLAGRSVAVFGDDDIGDIELVVLLRFLEMYLVIAMDEDHHVGILFNGAGIPQIRQPRPEIAAALLHGPGKL